MAGTLAANYMLNLALRALKLICAIVVIGTDSYAIHAYHGHNSIAHTPEGDFVTYAGVPNAWGFLLFCAAWTILVVILQTLARGSFADRAWMGYVHIGAEVLAVLSWFAGWVAVAVNTGTEACSEGFTSCGALKAATVFGATAWLLFMVTATLAFSLFLNGKRQQRSSTV